MNELITYPVMHLTYVTVEKKARLIEMRRVDLHTARLLRVSFYITSRVFGHGSILILPDYSTQLFSDVKSCQVFVGTGHVKLGTLFCESHS